MKTIFIDTIPTADLNVIRMSVDFKDFDPFIGLTFTCTFFNARNMIIDRVYVELTNADWQDWPASQSSDEDYDYVKSIVLRNLNIQEYIPEEPPAPDEPVDEVQPDPESDTPFVPPPDPPMP
jgi:hypothetical protein